jgi:glutathione peroxidase
MKVIKINLLIIITLFFSIQVIGQKKTLHDFKATTIDGEEFDFSSVNSKKVLIVNIATECSLAPQLKKLQELYEEYGGDDFEIIGFPCNDFGKQEPGESEEIKEVCTNKYAITFQLMEKIEIKGDNPHPIYKWLTSSEENGTLDAKVTWNYQKFLINENGEVVDSYSPISSPKSNRIVEWLME